MEFNNQVGLPTSLADLGMIAPSAEEIAEIARLTSIGPKGGRIIVAASPEQIAAAIDRVEALEPVLQPAEYPPSTGRMMPVTHQARGDQRKAPPKIERASGRES